MATPRRGTWGPRACWTPATHLTLPLRWPHRAACRPRGRVEGTPWEPQATRKACTPRNQVGITPVLCTSMDARALSDSAFVPLQSVGKLVRLSNTVGLMVQRYTWRHMIYNVTCAAVLKSSLVSPQHHVNLMCLLTSTHGSIQCSLHWRCPCMCMQCHLNSSYLQ